MLRFGKLKDLVLCSWHVSGFRRSGKTVFSVPAIFSLNDKVVCPPHIWRNNSVDEYVHFFSTTAGTILVQARDPAKLCMDIENALIECRYGDAWRFFEQHMQMEGFPRKSVVNMLLAGYAGTLDTRLLNQAFGLVEQIFEEGKQTLLEKETLLYLALALSKCGLPEPASILLRKLIQIEEYPPVSAWSAVLAYMSLSSSGAYLAAELILEIGHLFKDNRIDPRKKINAPLIAMKPETFTFSAALAGCLVFGTTRIAEELLEMMPRIGVKTDTTLLILMTHVYERNGRREELKKLKRFIDEAHDLNEIQFRQYYNCLLNCHLKFGDLDSASRMVLEMLHKAKEAQNSLAAATLMFEPVKKGIPSTSTLMDTSASGKSEQQAWQFISFENFCRDRNFTSLRRTTKEILESLSLELQKQIDLVITKRGILQPTNKAYVKLAKAYLKANKTKELAEFLIKAEQKELPSSVDNSALVHVINTCISLDWLDQAHDILDEMRFAGIRTSSSVYASLLKAYCKANRTNEVMSLLREVRRARIQLDGSCYEALIELRVLHKDSLGALDLFKEMKEAKIPRNGHQEFEVLVEGCAQSGEAGFMAKLLQEIKEGERVDCGVHDWNNVIHFFCKKRLMQDAEKALKKMRSLGHTPNAQTFHSMVTGYAAVGGKYTEVTELWGEMKSLASATQMKFDQELLDSVLYTFVRGGFFIRANEVVEIMEKGNMFVDKYRYRTLFLKYHRTLHKGKSPKSLSEAQFRRREAALSFKKWIGLF